MHKQLGRRQTKTINFCSCSTENEAINADQSGLFDFKVELIKQSGKVRLNKNVPFLSQSGLKSVPEVSLGNEIMFPVSLCEFFVQCDFF